MSKEDEKKGKGKGISRRCFFSMMGWGGLLTTMGGSTVSLFKYMSPNVLYEPPTVFKIGYPEDYRKGVSEKWKREGRFWVVKDNRGIYVLIAICRHLGCTPNCPSVAAMEFRELIKSKLVKGETKEEILKYFLDTYGPEILGAPVKRGFSLLAWWVPYFAIADAAIIIGIIVFLWKKRGKLRGSSTTDGIVGEEYEREIEEELKKMDL
ncbi:MAG: cytochrome c-type biogenesis protein CcmH [Thermodesulfobacteriota bacterium]